MSTDSSYLNYRCTFCKQSHMLPDRIDHKCKDCGKRLVRSTHSDKKLEKARREVSQLYSMFNQE